MDASLLEKPGHLHRTARATNFFVLTEDQIEGLARLEPRASEHFNGLHHGHQVALVVPRTATPDEPVDRCSGERRLLPIAFSAGRHGDHVLMRHQSDRRNFRVAAGPGVDKTVLADHLALQHGVRLRIARLQMGVQANELLGVGIGVSERRDGLETHRRAEASRCRCHVNGNWRYRRHHHLTRYRQQRLRTNCESQHEDGGAQQREQLAHVQRHRQARIS